MTDQPKETPGFTPGPWNVGRWPRTAAFGIYAHKALGVSDANIARTFQPAEVTAAQAESNAHLIAAAPDLFAALERLLTAQYPLPRGSGLDANDAWHLERGWAAENARAALAKAKGET